MAKAKKPGAAKRSAKPSASKKAKPKTVNKKKTVTVPAKVVSEVAGAAPKPVSKEQAEQDLWKLMEKLVVTGDLNDLEPKDRVLYYHKMCASLGLNPLTRPFEYIVLDKKLTLYARATAAEQLRESKNISINRVEVYQEGLLITAIAYGSQPNGRTDTSRAVLNLEKYDGKGWQPLRGQELANAMMKVETKAKRRLTLSMSGLNIVDESELDSIRGLEFAHVNATTGIVENIQPSKPVDDEPQDAFVRYADKFDEMFENAGKNKGDLKAVIQRAQRAGWHKDKITGVCLTLQWEAEKVMNWIGSKLEQADADEAARKGA